VPQERPPLWSGRFLRFEIPQSKLAAALRFISCRTVLKCFLSEAASVSEIDNNTVERAIRPQTVTRKLAVRRKRWPQPGWQASPAVHCGPRFASG